MLVFTAYLSECSCFRKIAVSFLARIVLKLMVSLIDHLVACSTRISVDRQTDKPSTETLAAHAHAGVVGSTCVRDTPCRTVTCVSTRKLLCCVVLRIGQSGREGGPESLKLKLKILIILLCGSKSICKQRGAQFKRTSSLLP